MKNALLALCAVLSAAPVQAQALPGDQLDRLRRSFYGCDSFGSCVTVTVDLTQAAPENEFYQGTVSWRARFAKPAWIYRFTWPEIESASYWEFGGGLFAPTLFETGTVSEYFRAVHVNPGPGTGGFWLPWRPTLVDGFIQYPEPGGVYGDATHDVSVRLSVTPEPATLLLLATGLGVIGAGARRRAKRESEDLNR